MLTSEGNGASGYTDGWEGQDLMPALWTHKMLLFCIILYYIILYVNI